MVAPKLHDPLKAPALLRRACAKAKADLVFSADLQGDLLSADIFVYLSCSEGLGSAILLAMARGIPVVASREGGIQTARAAGHTLRTLVLRQPRSDRRQRPACQHRVARPAHRPGRLLEGGLSAGEQSPDLRRAHLRATPLWPRLVRGVTA